MFQLGPKAKQIQVKLKGQVHTIIYVEELLH